MAIGDAIFQQSGEESEDASMKAAAKPAYLTGRPRSLAK
jgi:hypothetical protein